MDRIVVDADTRVLVLTGAGVSAESGIPTFRDANGLWENHAVEQVASYEGFVADPVLVWRFYSQRREGASRCRPNPGHEALSALEARLGDRFLLATQNVDGLHRDAGSERVVEMHGNLFMSRGALCGHGPVEDRTVYAEGEVPGCGECDARGDFGLLRPHIVWFGEALEPADLMRIESFMRRASRGRWIFLAAGTSGAVYPAAGLVERARAMGAETWLVNLDPPENVGVFEHFVRGRSGEVLPGLFDLR
ncbi:MAG: Sir2 family NAD-dependent protein deacetylase [Polyangiales bacterium]